VQLQWRRSVQVKFFNLASALGLVDMYFIRISLPLKTNCFISEQKCFFNPSNQPGKPLAEYFVGLENCGRHINAIK
jgi:hypothetical protein